MIEFEADTAPPLVSFDDWLAERDALINGVLPLDVLRHEWHLDQNVWAEACPWCNPRHVDVSA